MEQDTIALLREIYNQEEALTLLNTYKGIPIESEATIMRVGRRSLSLQATKKQALAIQQQGETFINHARFPATLRGHLLNVELMEQVVDLSELTFTTTKLGKRKEGRVEPAKPSLVMITSNFIANTHLLDISANGLAVAMEITLFDSNNFGEGKTVHLDFRDPVTRSQVRKIKGTITSIKELVKDKLYRLGIHTYPTELDREGIAAYVSQRQVELAKEFAALLRPSQ